MFDYGTKVIVLASSHRGSVGPRKGSLAFFSGFGNTPHIDVYQDKNYIFAHAELSFFRYGFEKKLRAEKRGVIILLPIISENYTDLSGQIMKLSRRIHSGKDTSWNPVRSVCNANGKTPVVMVAPLGTAGNDLRTCDPMERLAWIESIVRNNTLAHWVAQALGEQHLDKSEHPALTLDTAFLLRDLTSHKDIRKEYAFSNRLAKISSTVTSISIANIVKNRSSVVDRLHILIQLSHGHPNFMVTGKNGIVRKAVTLLFYQCLFQPYLVDKLKKKLVLEFGKQIVPFFEEAELVRGCLLELSACLARTGKIDGKKAMSVGQ